MATSSSFNFNILLFSLICIISFSISHSQFTPPPPTALYFPIRKNETTLLYYTTIEIGDQRITKNLGIDLGGQYVWFNCDSYQSSLYRPIPCDSKTCHASKSSGCFDCYDYSPRPGCHNHTCGVYASDPFNFALFFQGLGKDTMSVSSTNGHSILLNYDANEFIFSCTAPYFPENVGTGLDGFASLTRSSTSLQAQLSSTFKLANIFALCLPSSSKNGLGDLFIGGGPYFMPPGGKFLSKSLTTTPLLVNPVGFNEVMNARRYKSDEYFIDVKAIKIDGKVVPIKPYLLLIDKTGRRGTKISTVTPYTRLHPSIYKVFIKRFVNAALLRKIKRVESVAPFGACFEAKSGSWFPEIELVLSGENAVWKIEAANSMVEVKKNVLCLGFVEEGVDSRTSIVIGGKQLENYLLEFDLESSKLGFSSSLLHYNTSCSHYRLN